MNRFTIFILLSILLIVGVIFGFLKWNDTEIIETELPFYLSVNQNIYMKTGVKESQILDLRDLLKSQTLVQSVKYISAEERFADFKKKYRDNDLVSQELNKLEINPLGGSLEITISDPDKIEEFIDFIKINDKNLIVDSILPRP